MPPTPMPIDAATDTCADTVNLDTARRSPDDSDATEDPGRPERPADTFVFEGVEVQVSRPDSKWHLRAAGQEAIHAHLGEATRILFNPNFHADTTPLINEILEWAANVRRSRAA